MPATFKVTIVDPKDAEAAANGGDPLRTLCRQEVEEFDSYMRQNEPNWGDGLSEWEQQILKTYLYQKIRGRIEPPKNAPSDLPPERANGTT